MNVSKAKWVWVLTGLCAVSLLVLLLLQGRRLGLTAVRPTAPAGEAALQTGGASKRAAQSDAAKVLVGRKLRQFAQSRRQLVLRLAEEGQTDLSTALRFLDAVEDGAWDEAPELFQELQARRQQTEPTELEHRIWQALAETHSVARVVYTWPPEQLLAYGQAILSALRPGMVYLAGSEPGRFIPTLLNETSDGERHVILAPTAFADHTYMAYVHDLYKDRLSLPTTDECSEAFQFVITDLQRRWQHDQSFPDQPAQVRPGEHLQISSNRVMISGSTAVLALDEKILQTIMQKNPTVRFALEESSPFPSMHATAAPLGPLLELQAVQESAPFSAELAEHVLQGWRARTRVVASETSEEHAVVRSAWVILLKAHGRVFALHNRPLEAQQIKRMADELAL
jgi:hypothetical protein